MNNIYGIGLPRTGTASLNKALQMLGKESNHRCILHDNKQKPITVTDIYNVDNSFYQHFRTTLYNTRFKNSLFILTTRDRTDWETSISRFNGPEDIPNIEDYEYNIKQIFADLNKATQLLIINIFKDPNSFKKLATFLGVKHNNLEFPHTKKLSHLRLQV